MPHNRAVAVMLSAGERKRLKICARGARTAYRDWLRRRSCWLLPVAGPVYGSRQTCTSAWIRSASGGAGSLPAAWMAWRTPLPRSGRPPRISALERAAVVALAFQLPAATGVPLAR